MDICLKICRFLDDFYNLYNKWLQQESNFRIAMCAAGSVRSPFDKGNLTMEDILTTLPFSNTYDAVSLQGRYIREALELSVSRLNSSGGGDWGGFLHVSGLQVICNLNNKVGDRIVSITVIEDEAALEDNRMYNLVLFDHLLRGGYRYQRYYCFCYEKR